MDLPSDGMGHCATPSSRPARTQGLLTHINYTWRHFVNANAQGSLTQTGLETLLLVI